MRRLSEGNLYNIQTEISGTPEPSVSGLETWKAEVRKQLMQKLKNKNIRNLNNILSQVFGETLDKK